MIYEDLKNEIIDYLFICYTVDEIEYDKFSELFDLFEKLFEELKKLENIKLNEDEYYLNLIEISQNIVNLFLKNYKNYE